MPFVLRFDRGICDIYIIFLNKSLPEISSVFLKKLLFPDKLWPSLMKVVYTTFSEILAKIYEIWSFWLWTKFPKMKSKTLVRDKESDFYLNGSTYKYLDGYAHAKKLASSYIDWDRSQAILGVDKIHDTQISNPSYSDMNLIYLITISDSNSTLKFNSDTLGNDLDTWITHNTLHLNNIYVVTRDIYCLIFSIHVVDYIFLL